MKKDNRKAIDGDFLGGGLSGYKAFPHLSLKGDFRGGGYASGKDRRWNTTPKFNSSHIDAFEPRGQFDKKRVRGEGAATQPQIEKLF